MVIQFHIEGVELEKEKIRNIILKLWILSGASHAKGFFSSEWCGFSQQFQHVKCFSHVNHGVNGCETAWGGESKCWTGETWGLLLGSKLCFVFSSYFNIDGFLHLSLKSELCFCIAATHRRPHTAHCALSGVSTSALCLRCSVITSPTSWHQCRL